MEFTEEILFSTFQFLFTAPRIPFVDTYMFILMFFRDIFIPYPASIFLAHCEKATKWKPASRLPESPNEAIFSRSEFYNFALADFFFFFFFGPRREPVQRLAKWLRIARLFPSTAAGAVRVDCGSAWVPDKRNESFQSLKRDLLLTLWLWWRCSRNGRYNLQVVGCRM